MRPRLPHPAHRARHAAIALCALAAGACGGRSAEPAGPPQRQEQQQQQPPRDVVCTADFRYGLNVTVVDSVTGAKVPAPLLVVATEGAYADTADGALQARGVVQEAWPLVGERAGVYTVRVRADGYAEWQQPGVRVTRDQCHVIPVRLTARLRRAP